MFEHDQDFSWTSISPCCQSNREHRSVIPAWQISGVSPFFFFPFGEGVLAEKVERLEMTWMVGLEILAWGR